MGIKMILASYFNYRGIPITITVSQISQSGTIRYLNNSKTVKTTDMDLLARVAETEIDMEVHGNLYDTSY